MDFKVLGVRALGVAYFWLPVMHTNPLGTLHECTAVTRVDNVECISRGDTQDDILL